MEHRKFQHGEAAQEADFQTNPQTPTKRGVMLQSSTAWNYSILISPCPGPTIRHQSPLSTQHCQLRKRRLFSLQTKSMSGAGLHIASRNGEALPLALVLTWYPGVLDFTSKSATGAASPRTKLSAGQAKDGVSACLGTDTRVWALPCILAVGEAALAAGQIRQLMFKHLERNLVNEQWLFSFALVTLLTCIVAMQVLKEMSCNSLLIA